MRELSSPLAETYVKFDELSNPVRSIAASALSTPCKKSWRPVPEKKQLNHGGRMESFRNRVVLITGAASGIGRQLALTLAAEGARIAALDRQAEALDRLAADLKGADLAC